MSTAYAPAVELVCPLCHGPLSFHPERIGCGRCNAEFHYERGTPDLIVGGRFDDEVNDERSSYEALTNQHLTEHFLRPTFQRMFPHREWTRVLSLGCGVGIDVDLLRTSGFDIVGIDCGNRSHEWPQRQCRDRLYLANGKHLPFADRTFDLVYCGCVFPHIGVEGDSNQVIPEYWSERLQVAREMTRVLKPGGRVMVSSPNRLFPLDLFHGRDPSQPYPRWNPPSSPFLLSAADYARLFGEAGCGYAEALPVKGYWGFLRMKQRWKGRLLAFPVETVFSLVSKPIFSGLRTAPISPWLVMSMRRG